MFWQCIPFHMCLTYGGCVQISCSGLVLWTNLWSLKNKELFQIGFVDHPPVGVVRLMDCPNVEP